jgi:hypothetical protein
MVVFRASGNNYFLTLRFRIASVMATAAMQNTIAMTREGISRKLSIRCFSRNSNRQA